MPNPISTIIHAFRSQVISVPDRIAISFRDESITYLELDRKSNQVANWIRLNFPPVESSGEFLMIPFCFCPGVERITLILAILKLGAAYVPVDPDLPSHRIRFILDDISANFILTDSTLSKRLEDVCGSMDRNLEVAEFIASETDKYDITEPGASSSERTDPSSLAYVMYTSGTTGNPKGVMVPHRGVTRLTIAANYVDIKPEDRFAQLSNIAFDASTFEIWGALLNGACLVVLDRETALNTIKLRSAIVEYEITILWMTVGLFNQHVNSDPSCFKGLRYLLFGGEAASVNVVRKLFVSKDRPLHLVNGYGPTENTTFSECYEVKSVPEAGKPLPIGVDISNSTSYVVDANMQVVEDHRQGELLVGGPGVALGYLNNKGLTDKKFIRLPRINELLYRTGDIVGRTESGEYYFVGRMDNQVKIRGYRIELEEIELVLDSHPNIDSAVLCTSEDGAAGTKQLEAYLQTPKQGNLPSVSAVRDFLRTQLPPYMLPSRFFEVAQFPLLSMGKVDRHRLQDVPAKLLKDHKSSMEDLTEWEDKLRNLWGKHLHYAPRDIGIDDNFFDLGGDSLLSVQLLAEIGKTEHLEIPQTVLFEKPTLKSLAEYIQSLPIVYGGPMVRYNGRDLLPLSPYQEVIWLHQQQSPGSPFYNEPISITMPEDISVVCMERALLSILERHQALRTRIVMNEEGIFQYFQEIEDDSFEEFRYIDLRYLPIALAEDKALSIATEQATTPFDLEHDQLIRFLLIQFDEKYFRLYLTAHHLVIDGIAIYQVFLPELYKFYNAYLSNTEVEVPDFDYDYADWLIWINKSSDKNTEKEVSYWKKNLDGMTGIDLPASKNRKFRSSFTGARECLSIPLGLVRRLRKLSMDQHATLFMVLQAAFKVLLNRYSRQKDLSIVTSVANRNLAGTEKFLAALVNTLLLRTVLPNEGSFNDVLKLVRKTCLDAYNHQKISLQHVLKNIKFSADNQSLINVAFVFEPAVSTSCGSWALSQLDVYTNASKFDLAMELDERDGEIVGRVEYNTDLFEAKSIRRLIHHYQVLLEEIVKDPEQPYTELPLLDGSDRQQLLVQWNDNDVQYQGDKLLHNIIEKQVDRTPEATAIIFEDQSVTYRALDQKSNQLAHYLLELGTMPDDIVVVWTGRSINHIIVILAVLKSGAAYSPLGANDPTERARFIVEDTKAKFVICDSDRHHRIKPGAFQLVDVDSDWPLIELSRSDRPHVDMVSENLAYVIYTSGSTGTPKGVLIEHRSISDRCHWANSTYRIGKGDVFLHVFSLAFDASAVPCWWALNQGAAVLMINNEGMQDPEYLYQQIVVHHVTTICATPSVMSVIVDVLESHNYSGLNHLTTGGDSLNKELALRMQRLAKNVANHYGPTEATVLATSWDPGHGEYSNPLIGVPIANTPVYILDENKQPVPVGVPGELYIGGIGVARGYLNRDDLTSMHFLDDPFSRAPNSRMYRTGDIVRHLETGNIEYLGRADDQVKIRGFRVELGEIDATIRQQSGVRGCIVIARDNCLGVSQIIAYFIPSDPEVTQAVLRARLSDMLPQHMVPTGIVVVSEFPLTVNGKVDTNALPKYEIDSVRDGGVVAPQTSMEKLLGDIWGDVLGIKTISIYDDFYNIGGDSLSCLQVVCCARGKGLEFSISEMLKFRTIASLSKMLTVRKHSTDFTSGPLSFLSYSMQKYSTEVEEVACQETLSNYLYGGGGSIVKLKDGTEPAIFLVHPAGGSVHCYRMLSKAIRTSHKIYGLQSGNVCLTGNLEEVAADYLRTIRETQPAGPYILGGWSLGGIIAFEICRQLDSFGDEIELLIVIDSRLPNEESERKMLNRLMEDDAAVLAMVCDDLKLLSGKENPVSYQNLRAIATENRRNWMYEQLIDSQVFDKKVVDQFVKPFVESYFQSARLLSSYRGGFCNARVLLLQAHDSSRQAAVIPHLVEKREPEYSYDMWRSASAGNLSTHIVPGSHENLIFSPNVNHVADHISLALQFGSGTQTQLDAFHQLDKEQWEIFLNVTSMKHFGEGEIVIREGETERSMLLISEGYLDVYCERDGEDHHVCTAGPNSVIGELAFLDAGPRTASIKALTNAIAYELKPEDYDLLCQEHKDLALFILRDVSRILSYRFRTMMPTFASGDVEIASESLH